MFKAKGAGPWPSELFCLRHFIYTNNDVYKLGTRTIKTIHELSRQEIKSLQLALCSGRAVASADDPLPLSEESRDESRPRLS